MPPRVVLVKAMNTGIGRPMVETQPGRRAGAGRLSAFGVDVVRRYRVANEAAPFPIRLCEAGDA